MNTFIYIYIYISCVIKISSYTHRGYDADRHAAIAAKREEVKKAREAAKAKAALEAKKTAEKMKAMNTGSADLAKLSIAAKKKKKKSGFGALKKKKKKPTKK